MLPIFALFPIWFYRILLGFTSFYCTTRSGLDSAIGFIGGKRCQLLIKVRLCIEMILKSATSRFFFVQFHREEREASHLCIGRRYCHCCRQSCQRWIHSTSDSLVFTPLSTFDRSADCDCSCGFAWRCAHSRTRPARARPGEAIDRLMVALPRLQNNKQPLKPG